MIEIGDPGDIEVVVDAPFADAVQIESAPGCASTDGVATSRSMAEPTCSNLSFHEGLPRWGSGTATNVIIDIVSPQEQWSALGDGYRVDARIVVYQAEEVLKVPTSALFCFGRVTDGQSMSIPTAPRASV